MQYKNNHNKHKNNIIFTNINTHKTIINIIILTLILLAITKIFFIPHIYINGPAIVNLNEEYIPSYESSNYFHSFNDKVKVKNKVNTSKEGNYIVTYTLKYLFFTIKEEQIVSVMYYGVPELTLKGDSEIYVCPNGKYEEPGFSAYDKVYGDVTDNVKVYRNKEKILYVVKNKNSKEISKIRTIKYEDKEKPIISLKGETILTLEKNSKYEEPGYTVKDNCDSDLQSNVTIKGSVDTTKSGTYKIDYTVTDSSNNTSTITRTVNVVDKKIIYKSDTGSVIYLTFDDGPSSSITPKILDILKEEQVPATFFVINHGDELNYLLLREANEGHTIALHSYTHNYSKVYSSDEAFMEDLRLIHDKVYNVTGVDSRITRFPGGGSNTVSARYNKGIMTRLTQKLPELGYNYFDWNVDSDDAGSAKNRDDIYNNVTSNLKYGRGNVVLMHDFENNYKTLNALRDIIKYGKENGYTFKKLSIDTSPVRHRVNN